MNEKKDLRDLRGVVASVCTTGLVTPQFSFHHSNLRDHNTREGFTNVEYRHFDAKLVEAGRDSVVSHALQEGYDWLLMIDGDAAPFPPNSLLRLLQTAFVEHPWLDVLGAYCQLKQPPYLPTIDTGTGTWELTFPGGGLQEVIRTGGHFFLAKTPILKAMGAPWFRTRVPPTPLDSLKEVDNFARITLNGKNPLQSHPEWETLLSEAVQAGTSTSPIGEDSGFCDNLKAWGGRIAVDTDLVVGHVATKIILPVDLKREWDRNEEAKWAQLGVGNYD